MKTDIRNTEIKAGKENPFRIPEGYFSESRANIMEAIRQEGTSKDTKVRKLWPAVTWVSSIAATLLIGFLLFQNLYLRPEQDRRMAQELEWFLNYANPELDVDALAYYAAEEGISLENFNDSYADSEQTNLLELTEFDELYLIEEWMNLENQ